jgi:nucleoside-diphosphate-sugar epimerase
VAGGSFPGNLSSRCHHDFTTRCGNHSCESIAEDIASSIPEAPPPVILRARAPFVITFREMREMRYLWREPLRLDNARLINILKQEAHTPLDEAVESTLVGLGCFGEPVCSGASARA